MKPIHMLISMILAFAVITPVFSETEFADLGKVYGSANGSYVMFDEVQKRCYKMDRKQGLQVRKAVRGWYKRNRTYIMRSRTMLTEVIRLFKIKKTRTQNRYNKDVLEKEILALKDLPKTMREKANEIFDKRSTTQQAKFCQNMAINLESRRLDITQREPDVAAYLSSWNRKEFREVYSRKLGMRL